MQWALNGRGSISALSSSLDLSSSSTLFSESSAGSSIFFTNHQYSTYCNRSQVVIEEVEVEEICIAPFRDNSSLKRSEWHVLTRDHIALPSTQVFPRTERAILSLPLLPSRSASPHFGRYLFPVPQRVGGWVDLGGRLHTEVVCPPEDGDPLQCQLTDSAAARDRTHDHWVASLTP